MRHSIPLTNGIAVLLIGLLLPLTVTAQSYRLETVASGLHHPWSFALLPDGDFLVTERRGRLLRITTGGKQRELDNVPETFVAGQGGFFDVVLHPDFKTNRLIFLSYAAGGPEGNATAVLSATLGAAGLESRRDILRVTPEKDTPQHYGGRLAFLPDMTLLVTTGEGFDYREAAQDPESELGKVLRIRADGSVPEDNFKGRIWTLGHRNPQGLLVGASGQRVYLHEHGPRGGDELNLIERGNNYGWPAVTHGMDYSGAYVSPFRKWPGMTPPIWTWIPSIAPSGLALYDGEQFPQWRGSLFVGALVDKEVRRLDLRDGTVVAETAMFSEIAQRIRDVRYETDGFLYLLTDSEDASLLRVVPAGGPALEIER